MDSAKKRTFHHKDKDDDEEEKKAEHETEKVEETEQARKSDEAAEPHLRSNPAEDQEPEEPTNGPKINFDYPPKQQAEEAAEPVESAAPVRPGPSMDDLTDQSGQESEEASQASQPRNPYAEEEDQGHDIPHLQANHPNQPLYQNQTGGKMQPGAGMGPSLSNYGQNNFQFRRDNNFRSNRSSKLYFLILAAIGLVILGGAVYLLKNQLKAPAPSPSPSPQVSLSTPAPTSTAAPLERSKFTVRVLNGTEKTGLAGTVGDKLKGLGYKIEKTANATNSAFPRTIVRIKSDGQDLANQLIKDLAGQFDASPQANLKANDTVDSEVILGTR